MLEVSECARVRPWRVGMTADCVRAHLAGGGMFGAARRVARFGPACCGREKMNGAVKLRPQKRAQTPPQTAPPTRLRGNLEETSSHC